MAKQIIVAAFVCILAFVHSAPQQQFGAARQYNQFQQPQQQYQAQKQFQPQQFQPQQFQPQHVEPERQSRFLVVDDKFHQDPSGEYNFEQKFASGEQFNEEGKLKHVNEMDVIVTRGSYTIIEKDGSQTIVNYTADENGFHPEVVTSAPAGK